MERFSDGVSDMRARRNPTSFAFLIIAVVILVNAGATLGQTTSFIYQGRLTDGGTAANGNYDLQFVLWDSASGGAQIGSTLTLSTVAVSNGVFTVSLDFGAGSFNGANRFLEISARPVGGGAFALLSPRQQVTATPYAIRSVNAALADNATQLGGVAASQYVQTNDSRLSDARPPTASSSNYIQNSTSQQAGANFSISGNGSVAGTLSANVVNAVNQYNIGGTAVLSASTSTGNTFVGTQFGTGGSLNTVVGSQAGKTNTGNNNVIVGAQSGEVNTGTDNIMIGVLAGVVNTSGGENVFIGRSAGQGNTSGGFDVFIGSGAGANNLTPSNNVFVGGDAGIGTTTGGFNAFYGTSAGSQNTTGQSNTFIGEESGRSNSTGTNNTALGLSAGPTVSNLTQSTAIGANATVNASNTIVLGTSAETTQIPGKLTVTGNVGIGTSAPDNKLTVNGTADKPGGGSWGTFSDERLKNLKGRFTPGLRSVMQLQPLRYEYKPDNALGIKSEGEHIGFSAQAVQKVIPEAISANDKGYLVVNNDPILWTMLNAIKEQQAQIETLRTANAALNARLRTIERTMRKKDGPRHPRQ